MCHAAGLPEQRQGDTLCMWAASADGVARCGSWRSSMAMHGERIYLLEQATTQMKYRQSANSVRIIRTALRYRRLFSPWARVGDSTWGKFGGDLDLDTPGGEGAGRRQAPGVTRRRDGMCRAQSPSIRREGFAWLPAPWATGRKKTAIGAVFQPGRQQAACRDNAGHRGHCD